MIDEPETKVPLTDLDRFIELYRSFGIECKPGSFSEGICITFEPISSNNKNGEKITGDIGVICNIWFTHSGCFSEQQILSSY